MLSANNLLRRNAFHYWLIDSYKEITKTSSFKKYLKYTLRYAQHWSINSQWAQYINSTPQHQRWKNYYGCGILLKLQYPYLSQHLNKKQQLDTLIQHYSWFFTHIQEQHYYNDVVLFSENFIDSSENSHLVEVVLKFKSSFQFEGAMNLQMKVNGQVQYTLTFIYLLDEQQPRFFIGGLQAGKQDVTDLESLKRLTKTMYGLRPKQFILHSLSILANQFNIQKILAVSNQNHIFNQPKKRWAENQIKTSLNDFWKEFDAEQTTDGNYIFAPLSSTINLDEIVSKKRSQYRKRQVILTNLEEQITERIQQIKQ